jgi:hypothetical protein
MELVVLAGVVGASVVAGITGYKCYYIPYIRRKNFDDEEDEPVNVVMHAQSPNYEDTYDDTANFTIALNHTAEDEDDDDPYAYSPLPDRPESRAVAIQTNIERTTREKNARLENEGAKQLRFDEGYEKDPIRMAIEEQSV